MALSPFCIVKILNQDCFSICRKSIQCFILFGWKVYDQREIILLSAKLCVTAKQKQKSCFNQR